MPFQFVLLWTDALVMMLIGCVVVTAWYVRGHEHLRQPWARVGRSPSGMLGLVVLSAFVVIGVLDSVHFRLQIEGQDDRAPIAYAVQITSVLDVVLKGLKEKSEKTYSAPLAYESYSRETVEGADGRQTRVYPRLRQGGAHLKKPLDEHIPDIAQRTLAGVALGLILWLVAGVLICAGMARANSSSIDRAWMDIVRGEATWPWRTILVTLGVLLLVGSVLFVLAGKYHVLGTNKVGQDVLYQSLKSVRTALVIGTLTTLVMLPFAVLLGIAAGYFKGWVDDVIQYVYTTLNSIPSVLLIAAAVLLVQVYMETHPQLFPTAVERADRRLLMLCAILGVTTWTGLCRLLRGETLKIRELEYIQAAQAFGVSHLRIITRHILPNVMHIVLIAVVMEFSSLVLAEAVLSYVGVGVDPSMISFGTMINAARLEMAREPIVWWSLASAFGFMFVLVLAANLFADAVRDAFDPRVAFSKALRSGSASRAPAGAAA